MENKNRIKTKTPKYDRFHRFMHRWRIALLNSSLSRLHSPPYTYNRHHSDLLHAKWSTGWSGRQFCSTSRPNVNRFACYCAAIWWSVAGRPLTRGTSIGHCRQNWPPLRTKTDGCAAELCVCLRYESKIEANGIETCCKNRTLFCLGAHDWLLIDKRVGKGRINRSENLEQNNKTDEKH